MESIGINTSINVEAIPTTTAVEAVEATIAVKDIKYPFLPYPVGIGIPYLRTETGLKRLKKKVVLRNKKGLEVVAIVGTGFALVPNELVEEITEKAIVAYGLTRLQIAKGKHNNTLRIDLLTEKREEVKPGDVIQLGVSVRNSIDGTSALAVDLLSYRLKCRNGAVAKSSDISFAVKHVGDAQTLINAFHKAIAQVMERFDSLLTLYRRMASIAMTKEHAEKLLELNLPEMYYSMAGITLHNGEIKIRESTTLWEAFNGITYTLTHRSKANPIAKAYISHRVHRAMQAIVASA